MVKKFRKIIKRIGSRQIKYQPAVEPSKSVENNQKKFRLSSKQLFLTYSRMNLFKEEVLKELPAKFTILQYVIFQEYHADETEKGRHIHICLSY
jgi:hypothetical protein